MSKVIRNCEYCRNEFSTYVTNRKYCSIKCFNDYQKTKKTPRKCFNCGKEFLVRDCYDRKGLVKYCSKECYNSTMSGSGNPNWRGITLCDKCHRKEHKRLSQKRTKQLDIFSFSKRGEYVTD